MLSPFNENFSYQIPKSGNQLIVFLVDLRVFYIEGGVLVDRKDFNTLLAIFFFFVLLCEGCENSVFSPSIED